MKLIINPEIEKFNKINNKIGVSPIGQDTKILTHFAEKEKAKKILDMGTGTGFIAIYLTIKGYNVDASDINLTALKLAKENAFKNKIKINFIYSDLFKNIKSKYNLIIFNPPLGNIKGTKLGEIIKSMVPKTNKLLNKLGLILYKNKRKKLISKFLKKSQKHLEDLGKIILLIHKSEIKFIKKFINFKLNILYEEGDYYYLKLEKMKITLINPSFNQKSIYN